MSNINFKTGWLKDPKDGEKFAPKTTTNQVLTGDGERLTDELATIKTDISAKYDEVQSELDTKLNIEDVEVFTDNKAGYAFTMDDLAKVGGLKVFGKGKQLGNQLWRHGDITFEGQKSFVIDLEPGTYTFSAEVTTTDTDATTNLVYMLSGAVRGELNRDTRASYTFTLSQFCDVVTLYASNGSSAATGDTVTFKNVMLNKGSIALPLEEYVGGPVGMTNPQSVIFAGQRLVGGYQLFDASKISTTTVNGVTTTNNGDGSFTFSSENNANPSGQFGRYDLTHDEMVRLFKAGDLYLDCGSASNPYFVIQVKSPAKTYVEGGNLSSASNKITITQEMLDDKDAYLWYGFYGYLDKPFTPVTVKPMLYQDGTGLWEPFTDKTAKVADTNIETNFLSKNIWDRYYANNEKHWYINMHDSANKGYKEIPIFVGKGNTVAISYLQSLQAGLDLYCGVALSTTKNIQLENWLYHPSDALLVNKALAITALEDYIYIRFYGSLATFMQYIGNELQIELGDRTEFSYEYNKNFFTTLTPSVLKGIPLGQTIPDELKDNVMYMSGIYWDGADEQYYIADYRDYTKGENVQLINHITVNSTIHNVHNLWKYSGILSTVLNCGLGLTSGAVQPGASFRRSPLLSNRLLNQYAWAQDKECCYMTEPNRIDFSIKYEYLGITADSTDDEKLAAIRTWVDNNELTFTYVLAEPIITPIPTEELVRYSTIDTYKPTTTIISDAHVEVIGLKDIDTWKAVTNTYETRVGAAQKLSKAQIYTDTEINKVKDGTYQALTAKTATNAQYAQHDIDGNNIGSTYETKVDARNKYIESNAYTDREVAKKAALGTDGFFTSKRDFVNGTLITTNIDYSKDNGAAWLLEIKGNSYGGNVPFDLKLQGYIYKTDHSSMIDCGGISNGYFFDDIVAFCYNDVLCFWFPRILYWQGFDVRVTNVIAEKPENQNCVVSVTDEVKPEDITKEFSFKGLVRQSITSDNIGTQSVNYAVRAGHDANGQNIANTYETKTDATNKLNAATTFATSEANRVKNDLLNGAGGAYDTLKELGELIDTNVDAIDALETVAASKESKTDAEAKLREAKNYSDELSQAIILGNITANKAINADKSAKDASGNVITSTYETKADATSKVNTINTRIDDELAQVETQLEALKPTEKKSGKVFTMKDISSFKTILSKGSTTQKTIPGNQLLDLVTKAEVDSEYYKINKDGSIEPIIKDSRANAEVPCSQQLKAGTYTASVPNSEKQDSLYLQIYDTNNNSFIISGYQLNRDITFTLANDTDISFKIYFVDEAPIVPVHIMLNEGSTALSFEPYVGGIASPNMNFPQKIEHAGKNTGNLFNLYTADNVKGEISSYAPNVTYNPGVGFSANSVFTKDTLIGFETDKQVTVQAKFSTSYGTVYDATNVGIGIMYEDGTTSIGNRVTPNNSGVISKVTSDITKKVIGIGFVYDSVLNGGVEYNAGSVREIMINEGPIAKAYEPYKYENNLSINQTISNKNIWDKVFAADVNNWGTDGRDSNQYYKCIPIYVGAGNTATFSYPEIPTGISDIYACVTKELLYGDNSKTWFYHATNNNLCINNFTITAVKDYLYLWCLKSGIENGNFAQYIGNNLQVELSETKTDYIEHEHQDIKLIPPKPFTKWDSVIEKDGWLYWNYKSIKLVIDGSNWNKYDSYGYNGFQCNAVLPENMLRRDGFCNQLIVINRLDSDSGKNYTPNSLWIGVDSSTLYAVNNDFYDVSLEDCGVTNWRNHLNENPLEVWTYTDNSELIPFTEEEMAQYRALVGYEDITTIQSDVEVEVAGLKDSDTWDYIHDTFAEKADRISFVANYGATAFSDIKEAIDLGKTISLDTGISRFLNLAPGTYDKNGNLVQSWDALTTAWKDFYTTNTDTTIDLSGHELFLETIAKNANNVESFIPPNGISNVISNEATTLVIHPDITHITKWSFYKIGNGQNIDTYVIPNTVEIIEQEAFYNYSATYIIMNPACTVATDIYTRSGFTPTLYYQGTLAATPTSGVTVITDFSSNNVALTEHNNSRICFHKIDGLNIINYYCNNTNDWFIEQINTFDDTKFSAIYGQTSYEDLNNALINKKVVEVKRDKTIALQPGTYDSDGNLIHTWEELLEASGLTEDALANTDMSIIPPNNIFIRAGYTTFPSKVVIPEHIATIGQYVFWFYPNNGEILPAVREIYILGENTSINTSAFSSATAIYVPWDSSVATVTGGTNIYYNVDMNTACALTYTYYTHAYSKIGTNLVFSCLEDSEHVEYICAPSGWSIKRVPTMKLGDALFTYDSVNKQIVISFE